MQRRLQMVVNQTMALIKSEFGVISETGNILASSISEKTACMSPLFQVIKDCNHDYLYLEGCLYNKIYHKGKIDLVTYMVTEDTEGSRNILGLFSISAINMKRVYDEKYDKLNFFKNVLLDNVLPGDIPIRARELNIQNNISRSIYLVKAEKNPEHSLYDLVCPLFQERNQDFVVSIDEENCVVIKEVEKTGSLDVVNKEITECTHFILNGIKKQTEMKVSVGIGFPSKRINEIGSAYKEAQMALLVGGIFYDDKTIFNYTSLGIGRLIYQLPKTVCKLFLEEIFRDKMSSILDQEMSMTFQKLSECSFNLSETARALFLHRNTLIYRIEKVREATNLDLRNFEDAVVFKVAMLVKKYLDTAENSVY